MPISYLVSLLAIYMVEFDDNYDDETVEMHSKFEGVDFKFKYPSGFILQFTWLFESLQYFIYLAFVPRTPLEPAPPHSSRL